MTENKIKGIYPQDRFTTPQPLTATKGKDINATTYTFIIKGDNTKVSDVDLVLMCKQYASSAVKIYRNTDTFTVIVFKKVELNRPNFYINRYGNAKSIGWGVRNYFGI